MCPPLPRQLLAVPPAGRRTNYAAHLVQVSPPANPDEVMNGEGSPDSVMATGWGCDATNGANKMCLPPSLYAEAKKDDSTMGHEKFAWDCEARFAELYAQGELDESESGRAPKDGTPYDFVLPASGALPFIPSLALLSTSSCPRLHERNLSPPPLSASADSQASSLTTVVFRTSSRGRQTGSSAPRFPRALMCFTSRSIWELRR